MALDYRDAKAHTATAEWEDDEMLTVKLPNGMRSSTPKGNERADKELKDTITLWQRQEQTAVNTVFSTAGARQSSSGYATDTDIIGGINHTGFFQHCL